MKTSLQTDQCLTHTLPLWIDLEKYSQITLDAYCQASCSLWREVCGLIEEEEEGLEREGWSSLTPTEVTKL